MEAEFVPAEHPRVGWFEGKVYAWGRYKPIKEVETGPFAAISGNDSPKGGLLLRTDGTVADWSNWNNPPVTVPGISNAVAVSHGYWAHLGYVALEDRSVVNLPGTFLEAPAGLRAVDVAALDEFGVALLPDGTPRTWKGNAPQSYKLPPDGLGEIWRLGHAWNHLFTVGADGTLAQWGVQHPFFTPPDDVQGVVQATGSISHSLVLLEDGSVRAWGLNEYGETDLAPGYTNAAVIAAGAHCSMIINRHGLPQIWGSWEYSGGHPPAGLSNVVDMASVKESYTMALVGDEVGLALPVPTAYRLHTGQRAVLHPRFHAARSYAWYKDGRPLPEQTRAYLKLGPVTEADAGVYHVVAFGRQRALSYRMDVEVAPPPVRLGWAATAEPGQWELLFEPPLPAPARLETSLNLADWEPVAPLPANTERHPLPASGPAPYRFYRLQIGP